MMNCYVVICNDGYSAWVVGVYTTEEKAKAVCKQNLDYYYEDSILED
jgi:hypothetical protein